MDAQHVAQNLGRESAAIVMAHDPHTELRWEVVEARLAFEEATRRRIWSDYPAHLAGYAKACKATRWRQIRCAAEQREHGIWIELAVRREGCTVSQADQRAAPHRGVHVDAFGSKQP